MWPHPLFKGGPDPRAHLSQMLLRGKAKAIDVMLLPVMLLPVMGNQVPLHPMGVRGQGTSAALVGPGACTQWLLNGCIQKMKETSAERGLVDEREANSRHLMGLDPRSPAQNPSCLLSHLTLIPRLGLLSTSGLLCPLKQL